MNKTKRWIIAVLIVCGLLSRLPDLAGAQDREAQLAEAKWLNEQAMTLYNAGRYKAAIPLAEQALVIREKALGPAHLDVAQSLNNLAALYYAEGDYALAEPMFQRALAIREKALGPEHLLVGVSLNSLAVLYLNKGDYTQAENLCQRALAIYEKALGPDDPDVVYPLNNLAEVYRIKGDYKQAEPLYQRALAIVENAFPSGHPYIARSLNNLALNYHAKGDYVRAEPLYQQALAIYEKALPPGHPTIATTLDHVASMYSAKGDHARAESLLKRALAIREKALPPGHPDVAISLNNLAGPYLDKGDYAQAEPLLKRALAIREKALGPEHPDVAQSLSNLSTLYYREGDYARVEPLGQRALAIREKVLGPEHPDVAISLNNLSHLCYAKGDYARAMQFQMRGNEIQERNLTLILATGSESQKQLYLNTFSSESYFAVSLNVRAMPNDGQAAQLALTTILQWKGRSLDAITNQIAILRRYATPQDQQIFDQLAQTRSHLATLSISGEGKLTPEARRAEVARLIVEAERLEGEVSRRSTEFRALALPITLDAVRQAIPPEAALVEIFLYRPYRTYNAKAKNETEGDGPPTYVAYVARRDEAVPQWVELGEAADIDAKVERLRAALRDPKRTDVQTVSRALDERVMRPIRKLLGPTRHLFLAPDWALNLIPFAALVDENGQYLIENYSLSYLTSGRDLLRVQFTAGSQTEAILVADPQFDLTRPVENCKSQQRGLGLLAADQQPNAEYRQTDFTKLCYPTLDGTAEEATSIGKLFPRAQVLTRKEATEAALKSVRRPHILHIATHGFFFPDQPLPPTEGRNLGLLADNAPRPPAKESPLLRSGLYLAGVKQRQSGPDNDGVLTALETAGLDLWGTKLVVLSACETGLGDVLNGAGVYGLRRALVLAGSETQVMSLWKVSDSGTRDLMTAYYTRLQAGEGRTDALRRVQLMMLRGNLTPATAAQGKRCETSDPKEEALAKDYRHPYYWAAFIPSGDWRNMDGKEDSTAEPRSPLVLIATLSAVIGGIIILLVLLVWRLRQGRVKRAI